MQPNCARANCSAAPAIGLPCSASAPEFSSGLLPSSSIVAFRRRLKSVWAGAAGDPRRDCLADAGAMELAALRAQIGVLRPSLASDGPCRPLLTPEPARIV